MAMLQRYILLVPYSHLNAHLWNARSYTLSNPWLGTKSSHRSYTSYWIGRKKCRIWPNYVYNNRLIINITCNYRSNNVHTTACSSSMCIYYLRLCFTVMHTCTYRCRTECILLKKTPNLGVHISSIVWGILRHSHACIVLQVLVRI